MSLPLFPLNTVLFPGCILDLQIFEARYLDMIGRCMKQGGGFGVVCILDGEEVGIAPAGYALVGCEALITDFKQQDNGLLGIRDEDADLVALLRALGEPPMVEALNMGTEATGQQSLANQLAYLLPFAELDKIDLLQLDDPQQRLDAIQALLDELQGELFA